MTTALQPSVRQKCSSPITKAYARQPLTGVLNCKEIELLNEACSMNPKMIYSCLEAISRTSRQFLSCREVMSTNVVSVSRVQVEELTVGCLNPHRTRLLHSHNGDVSVTSRLSYICVQQEKCDMLPMHIVGKVNSSS